MLKILVVDDEKIFRDYINTAVKWEEYGIKIIGNASNGEEAYSKVLELQPDVLLLDVKMPKLDGFGLLQKLDESNKELGIIIITGHDEFQYARKALKYGARDYLVKPFDIEELILTLLKIMDSYREINDRKKELQSKGLKLRDFLLNRFITNTYIGSYSDFIKELEELHTHMTMDNVLVTCIAIDNIDEKWGEIEERMLWRFAVKNMLDELIETRGNHISFYNEMGWIVSVIDYEDLCDRELDLQLYQRLQRLIGQYLQFTVSIGVSHITHGEDALVRGYNSAKECVSKGVLQGGNKFISSNDTSNPMQFYASSLHDELIKALRMKDIALISHILDRVYSQLVLDHIELENIRMISLSIISMGLSHAIQSIGSIDSISDMACDLLYNRLQSVMSLEEQKSIVIEFFHCIVNYYKGKELSREGQIAKKALEYIHINYKDSDLVVGKVAKALYINQSYLRSMFKQEVGMTLNEYRTKLRMDEAKRMIEEGGIKLTEIGLMIGYKDPCYFSRRFKQYFGVSPSKYELQISQSKSFCKVQIAGD